MSKVAKVKFVNYQSTITKALDLIDAGARLPQDGLIIIKPNLTNSSPPPVTTSVAAAEAVYNYCNAHTKAEIAIGEGCGTGKTADIFTALGYTKLAERYGLKLIDFNKAETVLLEKSQSPTATSRLAGQGDPPILAVGALVVTWESGNRLLPMLPRRYQEIVFFPSRSDREISCLFAG